MNLTRASEAPVYAVPLHHDVCTRCGCRATRPGPPSDCGSAYPPTVPGGIAQTAPANEETVYIVLDGELVVKADGTETVLGRFDSVHFARGEVRSVENRSGREAVLLVVIAHPQEEAS